MEQYPNLDIVRHDPNPDDIGTTRVEWKFSDDEVTLQPNTLLRLSHLVEGIAEKFRRRKMNGEVVLKDILGANPKFPHFTGRVEIWCSECKLSAEEEDPLIFSRLTIISLRRLIGSSHLGQTLNAHFSIRRDSVSRRREEGAG